MAKGDHAFQRRPKGARNGGYARPRVQIGFDKDTLKAIAALAKSNNRSFAAEVRNLVAMALNQSLILDTTKPNKYDSPD